MNSSPSIGVAKKKSFRSADMNLALRFASKMVLFTTTFVSNTFAAGDPDFFGIVKLVTPDCDSYLMGFALEWEIINHKRCVSDVLSHWNFLLQDKVYCVR